MEAAPSPRSREFVRLERPEGSVAILEVEMPEASAVTFFREDIYWLDLCLTPRPEGSAAAFPDAWGPHRYESLGDLIILPPGERVTFRCERPATQRSVICTLPAQLVDDVITEHPAEGRWRCASLDLHNDDIRRLLARCAAEARNPSLAQMAMIDALLRQITIEIARHMVCGADEPMAGGLAGWRLRRIDERLRNLAEPPSLEELAGLCNMSVRHLMRGFRTSRGLTIGEHITRLRIETAKRLLADGMSIKEVAFAVGFRSPAAFAARFRRSTALSPRQFRQRVLRANPGSEPAGLWRDGASSSISRSSGQLPRPD